LHLALFCHVIDNYGDAGVAWRLARRLGVLGHSVELWIDATDTLERLAPALNIHPLVQVCAWTEATPDTHPDAAICLFGAVLPESLLQRWAKAGLQPPRGEATAGRVGADTPAPVWINLEYLTCEDWALGCHGLPSPHPRLPLTQWFYFPGLRAGLGGIVCEPAPEPLPADTGALRISLFSYANAALPTLLHAWNDSAQPIELWLCPGPAVAQVAATPLPPGNLRIRQLPWLAPDAYDDLLRSCHLNFVRGEDSFVRAQLAGRPLVWQAYVQEENAHYAKIEAFLAIYAPGTTLTAFHTAWNAQTPTDWPALEADLARLQDNAQQWRKQVMAQGDLAENLLKFINERL
jgi:hypothetical protein